MPSKYAGSTGSPCGRAPKWQRCAARAAALSVFVAASVACVTCDSSNSIAPTAASNQTDAAIDDVRDSGVSSADDSQNPFAFADQSSVALDSNVALDATIISAS